METQILKYRKRKSHPLSDEIFISSTCARTQPFKQFNLSKDTRMTSRKEDSGDVIEISPPPSTDPKSPLVSATAVSSRSTSFKFTDIVIFPKIASVHTLTSEKNSDLQHWENMESEVSLSHPVMTADTAPCSQSKNVSLHQQNSLQSHVNSGSYSGNVRQFHRWHISMVCLKARAPDSSQDPGEEDVQEEDEVKLLEFAANCTWEGAKQEILAKVAQCLTRGQYPQPRTINVCEFVVEILPKAHQPSQIPPELRAKLPSQMYSIRVRITRRESVNTIDDDADIIDLTGSSPVKSGRKRKSHPLSDEIFISSTCARTQPFKQFNPSKDTRMTSRKEDSGDVIEISPPPSTDPKSPLVSATAVSSKSTSFKFTDIVIFPKIASVHTLTSEKNSDLQHWENMESEVSLSHPVMTADTAPCSQSKNVSLHQQNSLQSHVNSGSYSGNVRQFHRWHISMVCLKARALDSSQDPGEEDVQEEYEVKLLEFAANCTWEGAKQEILAKVAQCLTRGQYPQPRTINVCEFVVEILPKAHQPSQIPPELRAKLPSQMYSIRVRITRRESVNTIDDDADIIDLSGSSPVKSGRYTDCDVSVVTNIKESPSASTDQKPVVTSSDSSFHTSSSVGISGLSKLFIASPPVSGQHNKNSGSGSQSINHTVSKLVSTPNSRRASTDSASVSIFSNDCKQATDQPALPVQALPSSRIKLKGSSSRKLGLGSSLKTAFSSESIKTVTSSAASSNSKLTSNTASKKSGAKSLKIAAFNHPLVAKTVSSGVTPIFGPFSAKDVKYMIPGKDGTMQLIEVGSTVDKSKILIDVPITMSKAPVDLKGKQSTMVALPVGGMGQSRIDPILSSQAMPSQLKASPAQQIVLRLPVPSPSAPVVSDVRHPVVLQPLQSCIKGQPPRFQVVPVPVSQTNMTTSMAAQSSKTATLTPKSLNSNDEMIMVFDAAHIRASNLPNSSALPQTSILKTDKEHQNESLDQFSSVVHSSDGPVMSSEVSPTQQTHQYGTVDLTAEKVPLEDVQTVPADTNRTVNCSDNCDDSANATSDQTSNKIEHASLGDCSKELHTTNTDLFLKGSVSSSQTKLQQDEQLEMVQFSVVTEVSDSNNIDNLADTRLKEESLSEDLFGKDIPSEISNGNRNDSSTVCPSSPNNTKTRENTHKTLQDPVATGSKRHHTALSAVEEPLSPCTKKPCLVTQNPVILDEDSVASLNSVSGGQQAAASPLSSIERPKSVMSGALSTGSSDDLFILLSSDEDIDVGEDDKPDDIISYRARAERALENDHGSMYTKADPFGNFPQSIMKKVHSAEEGMKCNDLRHEDKEVLKPASKEVLKHTGRNPQKVKHHNQLSQ